MRIFAKNRYRNEDSNTKFVLIGASLRLFLSFRLPLHTENGVQSTHCYAIGVIKSVYRAVFPRRKSALDRSNGVQNHRFEFTSCSILAYVARLFPSDRKVRSEHRFVAYKTIARAYAAVLRVLVYRTRLHMDCVSRVRNDDHGNRTCALYRLSQKMENRRAA